MEQKPCDYNVSNTLYKHDIFLFLLKLDFFTCSLQFLQAHFLALLLGAKKDIQKGACEKEWNLSP